MRTPLATAAFLLAFPAYAVEVPSQADHDALQGRVDALEGQDAGNRLDVLEGALPSILDRLETLEGHHTEPPPVDDPPTVTNLGASCEEEQACSGNVGAADDSGSFTVTWGTTALTGFDGQVDGSWVAAPVDGDGLALYSVTGEVSDGVNAPVDFTLQVTVNDTVTPPPPVGGNLQDILDMPAGSWLAYGAPWSDLETSGALEPNRDDCGPHLQSIAGSWNGVVWDANRIWQFAPGGHGDGCFNGVISYDLEAGEPQLDAPHVPLNMPLLYLYNNGTDGWNMPYASSTPWPACVGQGDNCEGLSKADRLTDGPSFDATTAIQSEAIGQEVYGAFLRPRSSHTRQNTVKIGDYVYLFTAHTYGSIKENNQVWRFNVNDPANTIERMPDRVDSAGDLIGGANLNFIQPPGMGTFMLAGSTICEVDPAAGAYNCSPFPTNLGVNAVAMWDDERSGIWVYDPNKSLLSFVYRDAGAWVKDDDISISDSTMFAGTGVAGICIVPTANGTNPVIWGDGSRLVRWDGTTLSEVTGQTDQPAGDNHMQNKWAWNDDLGVCLGTWSWDRGIDAWKPDFSNWQAAEAPPAPDPDPEPQPGDWPTFAGHTVAPAAWTPAAWNEPIERQPEAPDYDALCPGDWADLHYTSDADIAGSAAQTRGLGGNVRIYLHGAPAPYTGSIVLDKVQCGEVVGVEEDGHRPTLEGDVAFAKIGTGLVVRGIDFSGGNVAWACQQAMRSCPAFIVLHDNRMGGAGIMGDSDSTLPTTYLELRGNFFGPNLDWHGLYLERSIGKLIALNNVFHASGNNGHALKNLANYSRIEGNAFSNVGLDGQPLQRAGNDVIGLFPLDLYGCTETIVRNNTFVFRTSGNVRTFFRYRGRSSWGACDKGRRLADGSREMFPPESEEYNDPAKWVEIDAALADFDLGFETARANPWLFAHLVEDNTFIAFIAKEGTEDFAAISVHSLRPTADNTVKAGLKAEAESLITLCGQGDFDCFYANAGEAVRYATDHMHPGLHSDLVNNAGFPENIPIAAPEAWRERAGVYWDSNQHFIDCNADGSQCAERSEPRPADSDPSPWDDLQVAVPPRLITLQ